MCVLVFILERAFTIPDNKKIIAVFVFLFFTGEWRSRLTVLILKNAKEDAQQLQSLFPYILSEKILRRENTLLARILQQHTVLNCSEDYFFVFYLLGKWGKYALRSANKIKRKISLTISAIKLNKPENQQTSHTQVLLKICNMIL